MELPSEITILVLRERKETMMYLIFVVGGLSISMGISLSVSMEGGFLVFVEGGLPISVKSSLLRSRR